MKQNETKIKNCSFDEKSLDKLENDEEINNFLINYLENMESKKYFAKKEKLNLIKSNKKLKNEIEDLNYELKVLENKRNNLIYNSKIKIEKTLKEINKLKNDNKLQKLIKKNEFELNVKKIEIEKNNKINNINISFIKEKSEIDKNINDKLFKQKYKELVYERDKNRIKCEFIKNNEELDYLIFFVSIFKKYICNIFKSIFKRKCPSICTKKYLNIIYTS